jgi:hypothetical protein
VQQWLSVSAHRAMRVGLRHPDGSGSCLVLQLFSASIKDGKLQLGKLRGGKIDDITVLVAYVEAVKP